MTIPALCKSGKRTVLGCIPLAPTWMIKDHLILTASRSQLIAHLADVFEVPEMFMEEQMHQLEERLHALPHKLN